MKYGKAYFGEKSFDVVYIDGKGWHFPAQGDGRKVLLDEDGRIIDEPAYSVEEFSEIVHWPLNAIRYRIETGEIRATKNRESWATWEIPRRELNNFKHGREYLAQRSKTNGS